MKTCSKCSIAKPLEEFYERPTARDGLRGVCKECMKPRLAAACRVHYRKHPDRMQERDRLRKRYARWGLTEEGWEAMFDAQGRVCAVCGSDKPGSKAWHMDHDHACCDRPGSCGKCLRGILCELCNLGLGAFRDDPERLEAAAEYLRSRVVPGVLDG